MSQWVAKLDSYGQPAWLLVVAVALLIAWPLGIAAFAYLVVSGRMTLSWNGERGGAAFTGLGDACRSGFNRIRSTRSTHGQVAGNAAFNDYRAETLQSLESEEREFRSHVDRLRKARDQSEFEQFMADRRAGKPSV